MKWLKPSGQEIETTDRKETIEYCLSLGWEKQEETTVKVKRKRRTKSEMQEN